MRFSGCKFYQGPIKMRDSRFGIENLLPFSMTIRLLLWSTIIYKVQKVQLAFLIVYVIYISSITSAFDIIGKLCDAVCISAKSNQMQCKMESYHNDSKKYGKSQRKVKYDINLHKHHLHSVCINFISLLWLLKILDLTVRLTIKSSKKNTYFHYVPDKAVKISFEI